MTAPDETIQGAEGYWLDCGDGIGWRRVPLERYQVACEAALGSSEVDTFKRFVGTFDAPNTLWNGELIHLRGTVRDPHNSIEPDSLAAETKDRLVKRVQKLREDLVWERQMVRRLQTELAIAVAQRDENDRQIMRRLAPQIGRAISQAITQELDA